MSEVYMEQMYLEMLYPLEAGGKERPAGEKDRARTRQKPRSPPASTQQRPRDQDLRDTGQTGSASVSETQKILSPASSSDTNAANGSWRPVLLAALLCVAAGAGRLQVTAPRGFHAEAAVVSTMNLTSAAGGAVVWLEDVMLGGVDLTASAFCLLAAPALASRLGLRWLYLVGTFGSTTANFLFGLPSLVSSPEHHTLALGLGLGLRLVLGGFTAAVLVAEAPILLCSGLPSRTTMAWTLLQTTHLLGLACGAAVGAALYQLGGAMLATGVLSALQLASGSAVLYLLGNQEKETAPTEQSPLAGCGAMSLLCRRPAVPALLLTAGLTTAYVCSLPGHLTEHTAQYHLSPLHGGLLFTALLICLVLCGAANTLLTASKPSWQPLQLILEYCLLCIVLTLVGPSTCYNMATPGPLWLLISMTVLLVALLSSYVITPVILHNEAREAGCPESWQTYALLTTFLRAAEALGCAVSPVLWHWLLHDFGWNVLQTTFAYLFIAPVVFLAIAVYIQHKRPSYSQIQ